MAKTVRDILVNVDSGDLLLSAGDMSAHLFFDIVWGGLFNDDNANILYANIIIPQRKFSKLQPDSQSRYLVYARTAYYPYNQPFQVRLVLLNNNGEYEHISQSVSRFPVESLAYMPGETLMRVNACELPAINIDGNFLFKLEFGTTNNVAYVYTADSTDLLVGGSDLQSSQLLSICEPGKYYRYPTSGIGTTKYIGSVVSNTDLGDKIIEQFKNNGISVQDAEFDASTGELQVIFFNEEIDQDEGLLEISELDVSEVDVSDEELAAIEANLNIDDYNVNYDDLIFDIDTPDASLESCFANGIWIGAYPWTGAELWKGHE